MLVIIYILFYLLYENCFGHYLIYTNIKNLNQLTFEKHAPICTFGVGGNPLLIGLGGVCLFRSLLLGGTGGVSESKSGLILSLSRSAAISLSPEKKL